MAEVDLTLTCNYVDHPDDLYFGYDFGYSSLNNEKRWFKVEIRKEGKIVHTIFWLSSVESARELAKNWVNEQVGENLAVYNWLYEK